MRIGILGGTFNPIHLGHLILAQESWYRFELDKVIFVPANIPPHKEIDCDISVADRLNMVRLALEGEDRFEISTYEIDKGGTSYSIDTIRCFKEKYGKETEIYFLTGEDSLEGLSKWKDHESILRESNFVVAVRPGWEEDSEYEGRIRRLEMPGIDVSSTLLRFRIKRKEPIGYMVPAPVVKYIRNKGLYSS